MTIPEQLQPHFPHPMLLVVADHIHAQFWIANQADLSRVHTIDLPRERKSDKDTGHVNADVGAAYPPEPNDTERMHRFCKTIAEKIEEFMRTQSVHAYHLVMKKEISGPVEECMTQEIKKSASWSLDEDLVKMPIEEVLERVTKKF